MEAFASFYLFFSSALSPSDCSMFCCSKKLFMFLHPSFIHSLKLITLCFVCISCFLYALSALAYPGLLSLLFIPTICFWLQSKRYHGAAIFLKTTSLFMYSAQNILIIGCSNGFKSVLNLWENCPTLSAI